MGKGDRKTAKGKRYNSSYGNARGKATTKAAGTAAAPVAKKATKTVAKAPAAKKVAVKKAATKAREGVNPFTGEKMTIKAKPASKKVRIRALKNLNEMVG